MDNQYPYKRKHPQLSEWKSYLDQDTFKTEPKRGFLRALNPHSPFFALCFFCSALVETDSEVEIVHSDDSDIVGSLSWTAPLQDTEPVMEETMSEDLFTLPQPHRSFKEYVGNKTDLGRAVIPAAILAGYTGEWL